MSVKAVRWKGGVYGGKDLRKRYLLSLEWKRVGVMDNKGANDRAAHYVGCGLHQCPRGFDPGNLADSIAIIFYGASKLPCFLSLLCCSSDCGQNLADFTTALRLLQIID